MKSEIFIAGFGGQGVMLSGQILGYAAVNSGKNATYYPTYGAEQRGGTASCTVILSEEDIASPVSDSLDILIAMNGASLRKFEKYVKFGGVIIVNSTLVKIETLREDVKFLKIPANDIAKQLGNIKIANMVILGAYTAVSDFLTLNQLKETVKVKLGRKPEMLIVNMQAIEEGMKAAKELFI